MFCVYATRYHDVFTSF